MLHALECPRIVEMLLFLPILNHRTLLKKNPPKYTGNATIVVDFKFNDNIFLNEILFFFYLQKDLLIFTVNAKC